MDKSLLRRKESIVLTAIDIMSELGIQGLTTREIATRQGISEGTIFRHFKNKNEIILAVLEQFSQYDKDIMDSLRIRNLDFKEGIRFYITSYAEYYNNYPEIASIAASYDGLINEAELADYIKKVFKERSEFVKHLIEEGKEKGQIPDCVDTEGLASIIEGFFENITYKWRMRDFSFSLKDRVLLALDMILQVF